MSKITLFNYFKTGDPIYDTIITTIVISIIGFIINFIYENELEKKIFKFKIDDLKSLLYKKNTLVIEGKRSSIVCSYSLSHNISSSYSSRFKAILDYIILNIEKNDSIYKIKEAHSNFQSSLSDGQDKKKNLDIFMVCQNRPFLIDKNIYAYTQIEEEQLSNEKQLINTKTDKISLNIYSYHYSLSYLLKYIDNITEKYLTSIKNNRINQKFLYILNKCSLRDEETLLDCWTEDRFETARNFNNMFFDGKKELIDKIDYFLNNRNWYYEKGIPYTLGIGLSGPPGTGKTSFLKALAVHTNRNLIIMSMKMLKTKRKLEQFYFENTYNSYNEKGSVTFDKKIIVFEDIDCIGDLVLERKFNKKEKNIEVKDLNEGNKLEKVLQNIYQLNDEKPTVNFPNPNEDPPITLDDILNLWDGIRETPGRILIITSNHYEKLDSALVRPGRIDISHELGNASHNTIAEIYFHLFGKNINKNNLKKVKEYFYSPAELINIYIYYKNEEDFVKRLLQNKKDKNDKK